MSRLEQDATTARAELADMAGEKTSLASTVSRLEEEAAAAAAEGGGMGGAMRPYGKSDGI